MLVSIDLNVTLPNRDCDVKVNINKVYLNELQITPKDVIIKVAQTCGITYVDIVAGDRRRSLAYPRAICAILIKEIWPHITHAQRKKELNIHHSTIHFYDANHQAYLEYPDYKDVYEKCRNFVIFEKL
jgi:hypothetical protein